MKRQLSYTWSRTFIHPHFVLNRVVLTLTLICFIFFNLTCLQYRETTPNLRGGTAAFSHSLHIYGVGSLRNWTPLNTLLRCFDSYILGPKAEVFDGRKDFTIIPGENFVSISNEKDPQANNRTCFLRPKYNINWHKWRKPPKRSSTSSSCVIEGALNCSTLGRNSRINYDSEIILKPRRSSRWTKAYNQRAQDISLSLLSRIYILNQRMLTTKFSKTLSGSSSTSHTKRSYQFDPLILSRRDVNQTFEPIINPNHCTKLSGLSKKECKRVGKGVFILCILLPLAGSCCLLLCAIKCLIAFKSVKTAFLSSPATTTKYGEKNSKNTAMEQGGMLCDSETRLSVIAASISEDDQIASDIENRRATVDEEAV